ncbi:MAG: ribonuclease H-like YkuK family protein [Candidatus Colwellbacteria bacterium]|nr:ribonuclease H-like YkuK family protein [Candidatus Colwellbacteria bacterium]
MTEPLFNNSSGGKLTVKEAATEVIAFMQAEPGRSYKVTIGTDSEVFDKTSADFVTAIVVHRIGNGGRFFWRRDELHKLYTMRDRIMQEVIVSIEIAKTVLSYLRQFDTPQYDLEVHVDVGTNGQSSKMIQELVGMIRANNLEVKTKPEAYAASSVADRYI